ncbi:Hydrolase [Apiospora kogelbergensis]|uniref:Hydrolase n=1 Tax=Apiospora kogelbergensis TaxID=1337665 RepID=UPI00312E602F
MASNPPAKCCTVGVKHDGEPTGTTFKVGAYDAYLATPPAGVAAAQDTAILYLPDIISIWQNSKLMADQFAANGYLCLIIDLFNGDPLALNRPDDFDFMHVDPIVVAAVKYLREEKGVKKIGGVGYCFGAKYVARHYPAISVGYFAHPSFVDEEELAGFKGPLAISAAETDAIFPAEKRHRSEEILKEGGHPYQITLYSQTEHGFTVRCDLANKQQKFAKEQAFLQAVTWFNHYLL